VHLKHEKIKLAFDVQNKIVILHLLTQWPNMRATPKE